MSDRILVMERGRIAQQGSPEEVYRKPTTPFVADFVGQCNLIDGVVESTRDGCLVVARNELRFVIATVERAHFTPAAPVTIAVRPEDPQLCTAHMRAGESNAFCGRLESISFSATTSARRWSSDRCVWRSFRGRGHPTERWRSRSTRATWSS